MSQGSSQPDGSARPHRVVVIVDENSNPFELGCATEIFGLFRRLASYRGIVVQQVLLRKIGLPPLVANAIQEKLRREQEAEQMKFVLQKEQQEAERKRIEGQGIADFQRIVAQGISQQLLEWKGIEATEKLALSPNSKVVVIGNPKSGLPIILGGDGR